MLTPGTQLQSPAGELPAGEARAGSMLQGWTDTGPATVGVETLGYRAAPPALVRLELDDDRVLTLTPDHPVFARFLPSSSRFDVALVKEVGLGAVLVSGPRGLKELGERSFFYKAVPEGDARTEEIYLLESHGSEKKARLARKLLTARFGVPEATGGYRDMGRDEWRHLFREVDTLRRARELLDAEGMDPAEPHWTQRSLGPAELRKHLLVDARRARGRWFVQVRRPELARGRVLRAEARSEPEELLELSSYEGLGHVDVDRRWDLGLPRTYRRLRAAAIRPGMGLPAPRGERPGEARVLRSLRVPGSGLVYRVETPGALGILAEGVLLPQEEP